MTSDQTGRTDRELRESGFEKKGGYPSPQVDPGKLMQPPSGPAPGEAKPSSSPSRGSDKE